MDPTSGWNVAADAVKIGLPLLFGLATTIYVTRSARDREAERERRERVNTVLDEVVVMFEAAHSSLLDIFVGYNIQCAAADRTDLTEADRSEVLTRREKSLEEMGSIRRSIGIARVRLRFIGANVVAEQMESYAELATTALRGMHDVSQPAREKIAADYETLLSKRRALVKAMVSFSETVAPQTS